MLSGVARDDRWTNAGRM